MRRRDFVLSVGAVALASCSPAEEKAPAAPEGAGFPDPADVVRPLYEPYLTPNGTFPDFEHQAPWSADLWTQLQAMRARSEALNEPILDFDPIIGAQDYQLSGLTVGTESAVQNSHSAVRARFTNLGQPTEIVFYMVWEGDAWRVDNITGDGWDLRQIAAAPNADAIPQ
jgi:hypothetical protein